MLQLLNAGQADLVIGPRYQGPGNQKGFSNNQRVWLSSVGTKVARCLTRCRITDPMSGFFPFQRKKLLPVLAKVDPLGFKILFDILLLSGREIRITEIPYCFRNRHAGDSKLDRRVQWDFLIQIVCHLLRKIVPHDLISFISVGASGAVVQLATLGSCIAKWAA
jgi:dolichol-phosphate mannosyltransferase